MKTSSEGSRINSENLQPQKCRAIITDSKNTIAKTELYLYDNNPCLIAIDCSISTQNICSTE